MGRLLDGLIHWSIDHRVVVLLLGAALFIAGVFTASRAPLDVLPDFMPPRVVVQTEAPGMGTPDVEELVTRPLERVLLGTPTTTSVRSTSSAGLSVVTLMFEETVDIYRARQLVAERMELARARLPQSVKSPQLAPISAPIGALLKLCITSSAPDQPQAMREARTFADWELRPRLLSIPGIAQVTALGGGVERVEVRPHPARLAERGVTLADVAAAIRGSQAILGAGWVDSGAARLDVQNESRLTLSRSAEAIGELTIAVRGGVAVRVSDVAEVVRADEPYVGAALYDGKSAVYVQVTKLPWADTLSTTRDVERAMDELRPSLPQGAQFDAPVFRQASFVQTSLWSVGRAMAIGSALVIIVLVSFLRSGRLAAISLTAIPLSLVAAAAVLVAAGASVNGMTLGGLAIAVGEVVDDAIIDVENIWRRLRENARAEPRRPALEVIREASREVRGSVVFATLAVGLVLIPILTLGGIAGRIFSPLALAYMLSIGASLIVALTITPAMCAWLLPRLRAEDAKPTRLATWLLDRYRRLLVKIVAWPRVVIATSATLALGALVAMPLLAGRFLPEFHESSLIAHVHAAPGTALGETARLAALIDAQARPTVAEHLASRVGRAELDEDAAPANRIEMDFVIPRNDSKEWDQNVIDVAKKIGAVPGVGFVVEGFLGERIHEILSGETAPVVVEILGPDLAQLRLLATEVGRLVRSTPGFGTIRIEPQLDVAQLRIRPIPAALARYGVLPLDVGEQVVAWRQGRVLAQILEPGGRVINVALAGPPATRERAALATLPIHTPVADTPLSTLATIDEVAAAAVVNHDHGERRINIGVDVRGAGLSSAVSALEKRLKTELRIPPGYRVLVTGEAVARSDAALRLLVTGALVLVGIFVLLATAFGSLRDAGIVLVNIPLGLIGGVAGAALATEGLSVAGFVGFVTLFGIILRNGIMLVSHKRHLDDALPNVPAAERVLLAAEERLLPILMTALTAGLGLLPLALSSESAGSELESPMAVIVCSGLVTSTVLNMLTLPTIYVWLATRRAPQEHAA